MESNRQQRLSVDVQLMSEPCLWRWEIRDDERGSGFIGAFIVLFSVLTLGGVGVLVDSARIASATARSRIRPGA